MVSLAWRMSLVWSFSIISFNSLPWWLILLYYQVWHCWARYIVSRIVHVVHIEHDNHFPSARNIVINRSKSSRCMFIIGLNHLGTEETVILWALSHRFNDEIVLGFRNRNCIEDEFTANTACSEVGTQAHAIHITSLERIFTLNFVLRTFFNASIMLINSSDGLYPGRRQSTFLLRNPSNELENRKLASMARQGCFEFVLSRHSNKIHIHVASYR